jgi:hypothetical protein
MAQLGIRDKNYRPNQYINPMLISGGREPNPEDRMYRIFDKTNPEHPDYDKDEGEGDVQLALPLAKRNQDMTIANLRPQDFIPFTPATRDNDGFAMPYLRTPEQREEEMKHFLRFIENYRDGMVQRNTPMMLAKGKKKKKKGLTIYEEAARRDAFKDMGREPYDPDTGRLGGGFDIMDDGLDEV